MIESCATCKFWKKDTTTGRGLCRVNAPLFCEQNGKSAITHEPIYPAVWPTTWHNDWCGKFEAKEVDIYWRQYMKFLFIIVLAILSTPVAQAQFSEKLLELEEYAPWEIVEQHRDGVMVYERLVSGEDFAYRAFFPSDTRFYTGSIQMIYASISDTIYVIHDSLKRWIFTPLTYHFWLENKKAFDDLDAVQIMFSMIFDNLDPAFESGTDWRPLECDPWTTDNCNPEQTAVILQCRRDGISVDDCVNQNLEVFYP